jgi:4-hydroxy-tetrahydrodipicolinate synthase
MKSIKFEGIYPAMVMPFKENEQVDLEGLKENVEFFISSGCAGVVCSGSSGEAVTLSRDERKAIIRATSEALKGRGQLIVGTGAPTPREAVEYTKDAKEAGADAALVITPFFVRPSQKGLYKYYAEVAQVGLPVLVYNLPSVTRMEVAPDTLEELSKLDNIVGLKDSSGNLSYLAEMYRRLGDQISILTGGDTLTLQAFSMGINGAILGVANIAPKMVVEQLELVKAGRLQEARANYFKLLPVAQAIDGSFDWPAPLKEAFRLIGQSSSAPRLPLQPVESKESENIRKALVCAGLIS